MSFRYTNQVTKSFEYYLRLELARKRILAQRMRGRCGGLTVTLDAFCRVLSIEVEDKERYSTAEGKVANEEGLCLAVRGAIWDAQSKLQQLKIAEKQRVGAAPPGGYPDSMTDSLMLRPHAYEALSQDDQSKIPSWISAARYEAWDGAGGVGSVYRHLLPMLMMMSDEERCIEVQRQSMAQEEQVFWQRANLIRRAQRNTVKGARRGYKEWDYAQQDREQALNENIQLKHIPK